MKKKGFIKRGLALLLASVLILSEGPSAYAAEDDKEVTYESSYVEEGYQEAISESVSDGDFSYKDTDEKDISAGDIAKDKDISAGDIADKKNSINEMFPGVESTYRLDQKAIEEKMQIEEYREEWSLCNTADYVEGELLFLADTKEEALAVAKGYNATLTDYSYGVATITLNASESYAYATVEDAMEVAACLENNLPAVWPNYYLYLDDEPITFEEEAVLFTSSEMTKEEDENVNIGKYTVFDDPYLDTGSAYCQWFHYAVNSHIAHRAGYTGKGVKVAVLDTGVNTEHVEFQNVKTIDIGCGTEDDNNHGSHVCGIIGAAANNGTGGCGVAPDCSLLSIKVFQNNTAKMNDVIAGLNAAVEDGANLVNMSLGGSNYNAIFQSAIDNAYQKGVLIICSAGNNYAQSIHYPGGYEHVVSVAALNQNQKRATFSNYGKTVRFGAPGVQMWSTYKYYQGTGNSKVFGKMQGTSQAAPVVTGCAALLYAYAEGTGAQKVENLLTRLDASCTKLPGTGVNAGLINMAKAFELSEDTKAPPKPVLDKPSDVYRTKQLLIKISAEPGCLIYYSTDGKPVTYQNGKLSANAILYQNESFLIGGSGAVKVNAIAVKQSNQMASAQTSVIYYLEPPVDEVVVTSKNGVNYVAPGKTLSLKATIYPDYAKDKKVTWSITNCPDKTVTVSSIGIVNVSDKALPGTYYVNATSSNGKIGIFTIKVQEKSNAVSNIALKNRKYTVLAGRNLEIHDISILHQDKTKGKLSDLSWMSSDPSVAVVEARDSANPDNGPGKLTIKAIKAGTVRITGTAKDGYGKTLAIDVTVGQPAYGLTIVGSNQLAAGRYIDLEITTDKKPADRRIEWSISPEDKGVSVRGGRVIAGANAAKTTYIITAKAKDGSGASDTHEITIVQPIRTFTVEATRVNLNRIGTNIEKNINVKCDGEAWDVTSANPNLLVAKKVTTESGAYISLKTTGKGTGRVKVTVFTQDGTRKKKTLDVYIKNPVGKMMIAPQNGQSAYLTKGTRIQMSAKFITENGQVDNTQKRIKWSTSDNKIAVVDTSGRVTCRANEGSVTITATTEDGLLTASYDFFAVKPIKELGVKSLEDNMLLGSISFIECGKSEDFAILYVEDDKILQATQYRFTVKCSDPGIEAGIKIVNGKLCMRIMTNKEGSYRVTLSCNDGSKTSVTYSFYVYQTEQVEEE